MNKLRYVDMFFLSQGVTGLFGFIITLANRIGGRQGSLDPFIMWAMMVGIAFLVSLIWHTQTK